MSERTFDRETLLDLTVNIIPLGIILFFTVVYLAAGYWDFDPFITMISMGLLVVPFVSLAFLTYLSGRAVSEAEKAETDAAAIEDSFEESPALESNESEASADASEGVTDDEAAAMDDGSDTGEDVDDDTDATETTDATDDESESAGAGESTEDGADEDESNDN